MKGLTILLSALLFAATAWAQPAAQAPTQEQILELQKLMGPIPTDEAYRIGKLENGLTYYLRHNEKPKGQAEFYICHDVGAIQENDAQQGLAHFLEHMAFNGTKNLPGKMLTEYLEKVGVKFGSNLNAATSWDDTVYNISSVPTTREGIIDSALLILHDWSHFITLNGTEIDSERGVIQEELRTRDGAGWRSTIKMLKALGKGTKYADRNLIGSLEGLKNFKHEELVGFYNQWYRPDYQAIVVVGDIDVDAMEAKIKKVMSDIPAPAANASVKEVIVVPDNVEPIIDIFTDKEMQSTVAKLFMKRRATPLETNNTGMHQMMNVLNTYVSAMQSSRFSEIAMKPDAPFLGASMSSGAVGLIPTLECTVFAVQTPDGKLYEGFEALCTEMEKMRRYGFTQNEFDRVKTDLIRGTERSYTTRNDRRHGGFVGACLSNFQNNTALPSAETSWKIDSTLISFVNLEMVNQLAAQLVIPNNRVLTVTAPEKEGLEAPTAEAMIAIMDKVAAAEVVAHEDNLVLEPLLPEGTVLKGSPVKKVSTNEAYGSTTWTLKNGVRIIVKPTTYKADEIQMSSISDGGVSMIGDEDYYTAKFVESTSSFSGIGKFSALDLGKQLTGKVASASASINEFSNGVGAYCSPQDLETMLQLVYLQFTQPRWNEDDYKTMIKMMRAQLENSKADPSYEMQTRFNSLVYGDHFRRQIITPEIVDKIEFEKMPDLYKKFFSAANGYTFFFVGNIDLDTLKPLVEKYLGSLPTQKKPLAYVDDKIRPVEGKHVIDFRTKMQQPKVSVAYFLSGPSTYTLKNRLTMSFLSQVLDARYQEAIREEKGGTYGVSVSGSVTRIPYTAYTLQVGFDTNEEMADELREIVMREIRNVAENGPKSEDVEKYREYLVKNWKTGLEQNGTWMAYLQNLDRYKTDYVADYEKTLMGLSNADIQALATQILADGNQIDVVMRPLVSEEAEATAETIPATAVEAQPTK